MLVLHCSERKNNVCNLSFKHTSSVQSFFLFTLCGFFFFFDPTKTFRVVLAQLCVTFSLLKYLFNLFNCFIYPQNSCCFHLREIQNFLIFSYKKVSCCFMGAYWLQYRFYPLLWYLFICHLDRVFVF